MAGRYFGQLLFTPREDSEYAKAVRRTDSDTLCSKVNINAIFAATLIVIVIYIFRSAKRRY